MSNAQQEWNMKNWLVRFTAQFELAMKLSKDSALEALEIIKADLRKQIDELP